MDPSEDLAKRVTERVQETLKAVGEAGVIRDATGRTVPFTHKAYRQHGGGAPGVIHSRGEQPYSLGRLIRSLVERDKTLAPDEWALSQKLEAAGYAPSPGGVWVPLGADELWRSPGYEDHIEAVAVEVRQKFAPVAADPEEVAWLRRQYVGKAMDPLDDTLGGALIPTPSQGQLIELLRALEVFTRAGATQIPLPTQGALQFPRQTGDPTFTWLTPNATITDSDPGTGSLTLQAKRAGGLVKLPNDLIRYGAPAAELLVRQALTRRAALTLDLALLEGSGGGTVPLGLINYERSANNTPTADKVTLHNATTAGTNGDTFEPEDVLKMLGLVEEAPDPEGATAWVMRPLMFTGLANSRADAATAGDKKGPFLFPVTRGELGGVVRKELAGLPVLTSTQVSKARTKGSGTTLTYILVGNFRRFLVGRVGAIELAMSSDAGFVSDQVWVRAIIRVDGAPTHPQAFVISDQLVIPS